MSGDDKKSSFYIPARAAAISSICVNLVLIIVVGIILSIKDIDFLSTLALALAVIAFIVQIIVFIHQASAATMQLARSEELHGSTMRALAAIEEKAEGTRQTVTTMSDQMLTAMLSKGFVTNVSSGVAENSSVGGIQVGDRELVAVTLPAAEVTQTAIATSVRTTPTRTREPVALNTTDVPAELPLPFGKRLEEASGVLANMDLGQLIKMSWIGTDYQSYASAAPGRIGHGVDDRSVPREMYDLGLVKRVHATWNPELTVAVLTDRGRDVAALLLMENLPANINKGVLDARAKFAAHEEKMERLARAEETKLDDIPVED